MRELQKYHEHEILGALPVDSETSSGSAELSEGPTLPSSAEEQAASCLSWPHRVAETVERDSHKAK